jgi:hypothetical protein
VDIARTIRAIKASGLKVVRVVARPEGGVSIETDDAEPAMVQAKPVEQKRKWTL